MPWLARARPGLLRVPRQCFLGLSYCEFSAMPGELWLTDGSVILERPFLSMSFPAFPSTQSVCTSAVFVHELSTSHVT